MSQQINLYNAAFRPKKQLLTPKLVAIVAAALLAVLAAAAGLSYQRAASQALAASAAQAALTAAQAQLDAARLASNARKPSASLQAEVAQTRSLLAMRDEVLNVVGQGLGEPGSGFGDYLRGLSRQSQEGLWIRGFGVDAGGGNMSLTGRTVDKSLLPGYVRRLNSEKAFAGKSFSGLKMEFKEEKATETKPVAVSPAPTSGPRPNPAGRYLEFQLVADAAPASPGTAQSSNAAATPQASLVQMFVEQPAAAAEAAKAKP